MAGLLRLLSYADAFGREVRLSVGNTDSVKTWFGGLLTIAAVGATLALAMNTITSYLFHQSPLLQFDYDYYPDPGYLDLNSSNFLFSITDQDSDFNLSSAILSFNLYWVVYQRNANGSMTRTWNPVPLVKCTREYWEGFEYDYEAQNMANRLCPSTDLYNISGTFLSEEYRFLLIQVIKCQNRTDQPDIICKPKDELDTILPSKDITISFMYTDNIFNLNDWENPVKRFVTNLHWDIAPEVLSKKTDVFVSQYDIITDDNYLFNDWGTRNHSTYQINGAERAQNYAPQGPTSDGEIYLNIYLRKGNTFTTVTRQFLKISEVFESVGGLAGFFFAILGLIAFVYNSKVFEVKMANLLYEFDKSYDKKDPPKTSKTTSLSHQDSRSFMSGVSSVGTKRPKSVANPFQTAPQKKKRCKCLKRDVKKQSLQTETTDLKNPVGLSPTPLNPDVSGSSKKTTSERMKLYLRSFQNYSKGLGKKMTYTFFDFLIGIFSCGRRKKDKLIALAAERIQDDTDITHILKRIQELEKLKQVFFDEHQRRIFSYSRPPLISLDAEDPILQDISPPKQDLKKGRSSLKNSFLAFAKRRKGLLQKDPMEDLDTMNKFAFVFDSYRKIRKTNGRIDKELIRLMDFEMEQVLYNLDFELKLDNAFNREYFNLLAVKVFEDLLFKAKRKRKMMTKEDAANIIARKWLSVKKKRKVRDIRKVTRIKTMIGQARGGARKTLSSMRQPQPQKEEISSFDREMNDVEVQFDEHEEFGGMGSNRSEEFEDDEILNDLYDYNEDIGDIHTPVLTNRHKHRLVQLAQSSQLSSIRKKVEDSSKIIMDTSKFNTARDQDEVRSGLSYFIKIPEKSDNTSKDT